MMASISLLTLHRTANYGSVLQAFATQKVLERMGFDVTVVDYYPNRNKINSMLRSLKEKKALFERNPFALLLARAIILPSYIKRRRTFNRYIESRLNLSLRTYWGLDDFENEPICSDFYVTGSDQVWNSTWNGGVDDILFFSFTSQDSIRVSIASSFGKTSLCNEEISRVRELLQRYAYITVREDSGVDIVRSLGIEKVEQVLDPTLLLDKSFWYQCCDSHIIHNNYILMYNINHNRPLDHFVKLLSRKTGLPIRYISYQYHDVVKRGKMHCNVSVESFLSLIRDARFVVCDSFHCAAFSVNFNKEFAIVMPERFGTRLTSFMRVVGLEDRIVGESDIDVFNKPIDWISANRCLDEARKNSLETIKTMFQQQKTN